MTNVAGRDIMSTDIPTPSPSYTEEVQKEMLAADSNSKYNVVPTKGGSFVGESAEAIVMFGDVRLRTRLNRRRTKIQFWA
jgi:hypothetical protein